MALRDQVFTCSINCSIPFSIIVQRAANIKMPGEWLIRLAKSELVVPGIEIVRRCGFAPLFPRANFSQTDARRFFAFTRW